MRRIAVWLIDALRWFVGPDPDELYEATRELTPELDAADEADTF